MEYIYYYSPSMKLFYSTNSEDPIPEDAIGVTEERMYELRWGEVYGKVISVDAEGNLILIDGPPPPPLELGELVRQTKLGVMNHLHAFARRRGYADIQDAVTYVLSNVPELMLDGETARDARDEILILAKDRIADFVSGAAPRPATPEAFVAELPKLYWPDETPEEGDA